MGVPRSLVCTWLEGLSRLGRASSFVGDISEPSYSTTGVPEGDGASVAAAVAVGWVFSQLISSYDLTPAVFVDNWSWTTDCHEHNAAGLAQTQHLTGALRLSIDWNKSFAWSRDVEGRNWWKDNLHDMCPDGIQVSLLLKAKDLGAAMRYHSSRALGSLRSRMLVAHERLTKLASQPRSLANKAQLIQGAVWPVAFYGSEGFAIGIKHISALRSAAARAMVGPHRQLSPFLAVSALVPGLQDPEAYILTSALRALRHAYHTNRCLALSILDVAQHASGEPGSVTGPGSALKALLRRNGWGLQGLVVHAPGGFRFRVDAVSTRDIARIVNKAWSYRVRQAVLHRNGLHHVGVPDPCTTARVLKPLGTAAEKVIGRHIVGAFQTEAVKCVWGGSETPYCPYCGAVETHHHRFLRCPAFAPLRQRHPQAVHVLESERPEWIYSPMATLPDVDDVLTLVYHTRPPPKFPTGPPVLTEVDGHPHLVFFTDGSCKHPTIPCARHATWP